MLIDFCEKTEKPIYLYGVSDRTVQIKEYLSQHDIHTTGYVVSEEYKQRDSGKDVYSINEVINQDIAVILALPYRHFNEVVPRLAAGGITDIYFPTGQDLLALQHIDSFYTENTDIDRNYFDRNESYLAALKIFSFLFERIDVHSVIEYGCGCGAWLKAVKKLVPEAAVMGIDGSDVDRSEYLEKEEFLKVDLTAYKPDRKYDLAVSIEVAEHLDEKYADRFVENLCLGSDIVLFSAAIQNQGGHHHVNEQNPSYWRTKFLKHGYIPVDCIRPRFWEDKEIPVYYKQNCILYVKDADIKNRFQMKDEMFFDVVHPELLDSKWQSVINGTF